MLQRLKHAAMILAGYRPAEVRFDEWDRTMAGDLADGWAYELSLRHPDVPGLKGELDKAIEQAIRKYTTWELDQVRGEKARKRRKPEPSDDDDTDIPL